MNLRDATFDSPYRVYAFPSSYSRTGLTLEGDAVLDGVIGIPDGPSLVVNVGVASVR